MEREFEKDPIAVLIAGIDWSDWATENGVSVQSSTWSADAGLTLANPLLGNGIATVSVSGGVVGTDYILENTVVAGALTDVRRIRVKVRKNIPDAL